MWGSDFVACDGARQDAVLRVVQETPHPSVQRFFEVLLRVTLSGYLCAPACGGNRGGVGWRHLGFVPHPFTHTGCARLTGSGWYGGSDE